MNTVWKYALDTQAEDVEVDMKKNCKVLSAGLDPQGQLCVWTEVHKDEANERRRFFIVGTGRDVPVGATRFIGTVSMAPVGLPFIWHIYADF